MGWKTGHFSTPSEGNEKRKEVRKTKKACGNDGILSSESACPYRNSKRSIQIEDVGIFFFKF